MSNDQTDPDDQTDPTTSAPPPKSRSHGWAIAGAVAGVVALGLMAAAVIDRGDAGATANTDPTADIHVLQTTNNNTTTVTPPPATVTVENQVTVQTPTTPAKKPAATTSTTRPANAGTATTTP
jgi:hypothetical protein